MSTKPKELNGPMLTHPSALEGDKRTLRFQRRNPASLHEFATWLLTNRQIRRESAAFRAALESTEDAVAHQAAWLACATEAALAIIQRVPPEHRAVALQLFTVAFHAGARHESITVEKRFRRDVERALRSMRGALKGGDATADKVHPGWRRKQASARAIYAQCRARGDSDREARGTVRQQTGYSSKQLGRILKATRT